MQQHQENLKSIVSDIYKSDEFSSHVGEKVARLSAKQAKAG